MNESSQKKSKDPWFPWSFFGLIFVLSVPLWVLDSMVDIKLMPGLPLSALMILSAAIAAFIVAYREGRMRQVRILIARCADVRLIPSAIWYLPTLLLMPGILLASYAIMRYAGMPLPEPQISWSEIPVLVLMFLFAAACEELAWTATALDPLQLRWGTARAAVVIGVVWAVWHTIPFIQAGNAALWIAGQFLFTVVFRFVIVWLYNNAGKSVFTAIVCHASYNVAWQLFPNRGSGYNPWVTTAVTAVVLVVLVLVTGGSAPGRRTSG